MATIAPKGENGGTTLAPGDKKPVLRVSDLVIDDEHVTVKVDADLRSASKLMLSHKVSLALVLDEKKRVVGILRSNDILDKVLEGVDPSKTPVSTIMIRDFYKIRYDDDLAEVAPKIHKSGHKYIVVLDKNGKYKGYFSVNDLRHSREILYKMGHSPFG
jgi:predicted transcriptional regulator